MNVLLCPVAMAVAMAVAAIQVPVGIRIVVLAVAVVVAAALKVERFANPERILVYSEILPSTTSLQRNHPDCVARLLRLHKMGARTLRHYPHPQKMGMVRAPGKLDPYSLICHDHCFH